MSRRRHVALGIAGLTALVSTAAWPLWWVSGPLGCACCAIGVAQIHRRQHSMIGYATAALGIAVVTTAAFTALFLTASAGTPSSPIPSKSAAQVP